MYIYLCVYMCVCVCVRRHAVVRTEIGRLQGQG